MEIKGSIKVSENTIGYYIMSFIRTFIYYNILGLIVGEVVAQVFRGVHLSFDYWMMSTGGIIVLILIETFGYSKYVQIEPKHEEVSQKILCKAISKRSEKSIESIEEGCFKLKWGLFSYGSKIIVRNDHDRIIIICPQRVAFQLMKDYERAAGNPPLK